MVDSKEVVDEDSQKNKSIDGNLEAEEVSEVVEEPTTQTEVETEEVIVIEESGEAHEDPVDQGRSASISEEQDDVKDDVKDDGHSEEVLEDSEQEPEQEGLDIKEGSKEDLEVAEREQEESDLEEASKEKLDFEEIEKEDFAVEETIEEEVEAEEHEEVEEDGREAEKVVKVLLRETLLNEVERHLKKAVLPEDGQEGVMTPVEELVDEDLVEDRPMQFVLRRTAPEEFTLDVELDENALVTPFDLMSALSESSEGVSDQLGVEMRDSSGKVSVDREFYYDMYHCLVAERAGLQRTNTVLQKRLLEHFKRRRMTKMFVKDEEPEFELRYANRLAEFAETLRTHTNELEEGNKDLQEMDDELATQQSNFLEQLDAFIDLERRTGVGLVVSGSGRILSENAVELLLKRQRNRIMALSEERGAFIKHRDKLAGMEAEIVKLDMLGEGIKLSDYEQLRIENSNQADKIEEREEEMARLRLRTERLLTAVAHLREKSYAFVAVTDQQAEVLNKKNTILETARLALHKAKTGRDRMRDVLQRETLDAGLLTKPQLLRDYAETHLLRDQLRAQLEELRARCATDLRTLTELRAQIGKGTQAQWPQPMPTFKKTLGDRLDRRIAEREMASMKARLAKVEEQDGEGVFQIAWDTTATVGALRGERAS